MRIVDVLGIGFWLAIYSNAILRLTTVRCSMQTFLSRLQAATPALLIVFFLSAIGGLLMSGTVGLIGNSLLCLLWGTWFFLMWVPPQQDFRGNRSVSDESREASSQSDSANGNQFSDEP